MSKKLPWKIGAMESGQVAIDSADDQEVTGWIDPEDAELILGQQQRIAELEQQCRDQYSLEIDALARERDELLADALRYRWLRDKTTTRWLRDVLPRSYNFDADIDAAMNEQK
jgi:hypothetical protein